MPPTLCRDWVAHNTRFAVALCVAFLIGWRANAPHAVTTVDMPPHTLRASDAVAPGAASPGEPVAQRHLIAGDAGSVPGALPRVVEHFGNDTMGVCAPMRFEVPHEPSEPYLAKLRDAVTQPTDEQLQRTAIITMAAGDVSARMATAMVQSLRDVGTRVPTVLVLLVRGGYGSEWCEDYDRRDRRGIGRNWPCSSPDALAEDIQVVSPQFLLAWERMGVKYQVVDALPQRPFMAFEGDRASFWGMAMSKLLVFRMTQYRRIVWLDADTLVLHNIDHLMLTTAPFATGVIQECDTGGGFKIGGGVWALEPSIERFNALMALMDYPVPGTVDSKYEMGDMQLVGVMFGNQSMPDFSRGFPYVRDANAGLVPNVRLFKSYRDKTDAQIIDQLKEYAPPRVKASMERGIVPEGMLAEAMEDASKAGRTLAVMLDARYEFYAANCRAALRDGQYLGSDYYVLHFSCMPTNPHLLKPGDYKNEYALFRDMTTRMEECTRLHMLQWYDAYTRGMQAPLPAPLWNSSMVRIRGADMDAAFLKAQGK